MTKLFSSLAVAMLSVLASCQENAFGVKEEVWNTMSEKERAQVIENHGKQKEQELANERQRQELEAKNAPIKAAAEVLTSIIDRTGKSRKTSFSSSYSTRITGVKHTFGGNYIWIEGTKFEIDPFCDEENIGRWFSGQEVQVGKNDDLMYDVLIHNFDYNETVKARKIG